MRNVAMETLLGFTTAAGATSTAVTVGTGQSATIRNSDVNAPWPQIIDVFSNFQEATPIINILASTFPENQVGLVLRPTISVRRPLMCDAISASQWRVKPQDTLTWTHQGSTTGGNIDQSFPTIYYRSAPGLPAIMLKASEIPQYVVGEASATNTITTGTDGQWAAGEAFNAEQDPFKPNTFYCVLGYMVQTAAGAISYQAEGFGNLRVAGPADVDNRITRSWFLDLSKRSGDLATIPVFNSASLGTTVISAAVDENGADPVVVTFYGQLDPKFKPEDLM